MTPEEVLSIKPKVLTQKQREFYFENGYLLLEKFLPDARFEIGPGYLPDWDRQVQFDLTRSTRDLGYVPAWELEKGLQTQIDWIRSTQQR